MKLTLDQVRAFRMSRQFLEEPAASPGDVIRALCGIQAQVNSSADAAVTARLAPGSPSGGVAAELAAARSIRTWAMRGTLHVLDAEFAPAALALILTSRPWERPVYQRRFMTPAQLAALRTAVAVSLAGRPQTRDELVAAVGAATGDAAFADLLRSGWGSLLKPLAWMGELCNAPGATEGNRVAFTRPDLLVPGWPGLPAPLDAARTVIPAYLAAHGPATEAQFHAWISLGVRKPDLRAWFAAAAPDLTRVSIDGTPAWANTADLDALAATRPTETVRLLPAFDQFVMAAGTDNPWYLAPARRPAVSRAAGWIAPIVVAGGRIVGTWDAKAGPITIELFAEDETAVSRAALTAEAVRVAAALGRPGAVMEISRT